MTGMRYILKQPNLAIRVDIILRLFEEFQALKKEGETFKPALMLAGKGKSETVPVDAGFSIEMPQNYIPIFETYTPAEVEGVEAAMLESLDAISQTIAERRTHRPKDPAWSFPLAYGMVPLVSWWYQKVRFPNMEKSFYADERCTGCSTCERICPSGKIRMENSEPIWDQAVRCTYCFACLHYCPKEAIQIRGRKTVDKGRYHHPAIKAGDIAAQKIQNNS